MSAIGAVAGVAAPQMAQASLAIKPVDRDGDNDNKKPDAQVEPRKQPRAVAQHRLNVEV